MRDPNKNIHISPKSVKISHIWQATEDSRRKEESQVKLGFEIEVEM